MQGVLDILSSGVHDAKNQLFLAETLLVQAEAEHGINLDEARFAIELAALRLSRVLTAYKLQRGMATLSISMQPVGELLEEAVLINRKHCERLGLSLTVAHQQPVLWPMDRELSLDILSNALQNASRFARSRIVLSAEEREGFLRLAVEDDGAGFDPPPHTAAPRLGVGLFVAREIAAQHQRGGRQGRLCLSNGGALGGAVFELWLP